MDLATALVAVALGVYFRRVAANVDETPGGRWIAALLDYEQLKVRWATERSVENKLRLFSWILFALAAASVWSIFFGASPRYTR